MIDTLQVLASIVENRQEWKDYRFFGAGVNIAIQR
jgi:hypothetical protein